MRKLFILTIVLLAYNLNCYSKNDSLRVFQLGINGGVNINQYSGNFGNYGNTLGINYGITIKYNLKKNFFLFNSGIIQKNYKLIHTDINALNEHKIKYIVNNININFQFATKIIKSVYFTTGVFSDIGINSIWGNNLGLSLGASFIPHKNLILSEISEISFKKNYNVFNHRIQIGLIF